MLRKSFKPAKCKTSLKLAASRIKLLKNKRDAQIKQLRREVAQLLESGQVQTARIRVEHVNREEKTRGAYDLIEIYCELIAARLQIIESQRNCPIDLKEAIASVLFASPRCADVPELTDVRKHFQAKYGKDFVSASVELRPDCGVNRSLVEKLSAKTPDGMTKVKILTAIAEEHSIKWDPNTFGGNDTTSQDDLLQKGPSTFDQARRMHEEHSNVHIPYSTQASPSVDIGSHKVTNAEPLKNLNAKASFGRQNIPPSPVYFSTLANSHLGMNASGNVGGGSEARRTYSADSNVNYNDRPDWNMEFTDATAAAQAAADAAEIASFAARRAAELSSSGGVTPRYIPDSHGFKDELLERPSVLRSPGVASPRSQVNNASVGSSSGLAYDHVRDERVERPSVPHSPGEASTKSRVKNASIGRNSGLAYDRVDKSEENLAHGQKSYDAPGKSASYRSNPGVDSIFHGGTVIGDDTVVSDAYIYQGDDSEDDNSLSRMMKKLQTDAYEKSSNYDEPNVGHAVGDADTLVYEQHAASKYTEMNPWSAELEDDDGISDRQSERKNSFGEVNHATRSSEVHVRKKSTESFEDSTPDVKERYGYKRHFSRASTQSLLSHSSSLTEKQIFSSLSNEKAEDGLAKSLFADYDEERIPTRYNEADESAVVFDDYGSDDDVHGLDLDKGHISAFSVSSPPLEEAEQSWNSGAMGTERILANSFGRSSLAEQYSQGEHSSVFVANIHGEEAASETEEDFPMTSDVSNEPSSENEEEHEKSRVPKKIDDSGNVVSEAEAVQTQPKIYAGESELEVASDSGRGLPPGNLTGSFRNNRVPHLSTGTATDKYTRLNRRRDEPDLSPSSSISTIKASDFAVPHEVTISQPKIVSPKVIYADDEEQEEEEEVELDAYYWRKQSPKPVENDSEEKRSLISQNSLASDPDGINDATEGHPSPASSGKSHVRAAAGLSRRTRPGSSSTSHRASRKPSSGGGGNSSKPRARTEAQDSLDGSGSLKWRSDDKASSGETPGPSSNEDDTSTSKPAKPNLDSTSREDSFKRASHVHPKLPDYETFLDKLKTLRASRQ